MEAVRDSRFNSDTELLYFAVANVVSDVAGGDMLCFNFANPKQEREIIAVYTAGAVIPKKSLSARKK